MLGINTIILRFRTKRFNLLKFIVVYVKRVSPPEVWMEYTLPQDKHLQVTNQRRLICHAQS